MTDAVVPIVPTEPTGSVASPSSPHCSVVEPTPSADPGGSAAEPRGLGVRAEFGLSTDLAHVRAVNAAADSTSDLLGVPLSPAERADIAQRDHLARLGSRVIGQIEERPGYGGAWYDQLDGGALHIASTGPDFSPAVRAVIPLGFPVRYDRVQWSLTELTALAKRIGGEMTGRTTLGNLLVSVGAHEPTNTVDVGIDTEAPSDTEAALRRAYPQPSLHVTRSDQRPSRYGWR